MNNSAMIAFLPTYGDWCRQDLPHMTLVYCGDVDELSPGSKNELCKDAISAALVTKSFSLDVLGVEVFGDEEKVDVLTLYPTPQLLVARRLVERWDASEHPFTPHATIGPEGSAQGVMPGRLYFEQIVVAWGSERFIFPL